MKVYITQYALTKGILEEECDIDEGLAFSKAHRSWMIPKTHWFLTREEAVDRANDLRRRQILTYEKAIAKLSKLKFE